MNKKHYLIPSTELFKLTCKRSTCDDVPIVLPGEGFDPFPAGPSV